jgi:hypothetical protein
MKFQKNPSNQRVTPPRFTLIKSIACGLALLASGQAFAGVYFSNGNIADADLSSPTNWFDDACAGSTPSGTFSLTGAVGDRITICTGSSLNLSTAVTLKATTVLFNGGTWGGSGLKLGAGDKVIQNFNMGTPITIPLLDLSLMAAGDNIDFNGPDPVIFTSVTDRSLECPVGTPYNGTAITGGTTCTVGAAVVTPSVSAPIFSTKEKPAVFSEEVK